MKWNSNQNMFPLCRRKRWRGQNSDVRKMATNADGARFYKCECGAIFATIQAAVRHNCTQSGTPKEHEFDGSGNDKTMFQCESCKNFFDSMEVFKRHACAIKDQGQSLQPDKGSLIWNRRSTLLLISMYKQYESDVSVSKIKKKTLWANMSSELSKQGFTFTADQVCGRWKSLMRAYKSTKDHNKKSGNDLKKYEDEDELDELFSTNPTINPTYTLESLHAEMNANMESAEEAEIVTENDGQMEATSSNSSGNEKPSRKRKRNSAGGSEVVDIFKQFVEDQKKEWERKENMHTERMSVMRSLVDALKGSTADDHKKCKGVWNTCICIIVNVTG